MSSLQNMSNFLFISMSVPKVMLQSIGWRCVECAIHHERDVREEWHPYAGFCKENIRYPVWTCRVPISLILETQCSLILGTRW